MNLYRWTQRNLWLHPRTRSIQDLLRPGLTLTRPDSSWTSADPASGGFRTLVRGEPTQTVGFLWQTQDIYVRFEDGRRISMWILKKYSKFLHGVLEVDPDLMGRPPKDPAPAPRCEPFFPCLVTYGHMAIRFPPFLCLCSTPCSSSLNVSLVLPLLGLWSNGW